MKKLSFENFAKIVQEYNLDNTKVTSSAHHSNGSGRDWEAMKKLLTKK